MKTKCICKDGKTDPNCPACNSGKINLDSFHKLNPEADPHKKMAAQFKLAFPSNILGKAAGGLQTGMGALKSGWAGLSPEMRGNLTQMGKAAVVPAAAGALAGGLTADPGQGMEGALKGGLMGGALGAGVSGVDRLAQPGLPKVASQYYGFGKIAALTAFAV